MITAHYVGGPAHGVRRSERWHTAPERTTVPAMVSGEPKLAIYQRAKPFGLNGWEYHHVENQDREWGEGWERG